jgi:hypothetical protein
MGGSLLGDTAGVYNLENNPSAQVVIGSRYGAILAYDEPNREVWIFGGAGIGNTTVPGMSSFLRLSCAPWSFIALI